MKLVEKQLQLYPDNIQIEAVNYLYSTTFKRVEAKVKAAKTAVTLLETSFEKFPFRPDLEK